MTALQTTEGNALAIRSLEHDIPNFRPWPVVKRVEVESKFIVRYIAFSHEDPHKAQQVGVDIPEEMMVTLPMPEMVHWTIKKAYGMFMLGQTFNACGMLTIAKAMQDAIDAR